MEKMYLLQKECEDGSVICSMERPEHIILRFGARKITGDKLNVFDMSIFGTAVRLIEEFVPDAPDNYVAFYNPVTQKLEFSGSHPEFEGRE